MHLCAIALYRYNGIAHPLRMRSTQDARHVAALVVPAWTVAIALSVPFAVQGVADPSHVLIEIVGQPTKPEAELAAVAAVFDGSTSTKVECGIFNRTFAVYSSLVSFFIPLAVMIFADARSIQILRRNVQFNIPSTSSTTTTSAPPAVAAGVVAGNSRSSRIGGVGDCTVAGFSPDDRQRRTPLVSCGRFADFRRTGALRLMPDSSPPVVDREQNSSGSGCCRTTDSTFVVVDGPASERNSPTAFGGCLRGLGVGETGSGTYCSVKFNAGGGGSLNGNVSLNLRRSSPALGGGNSIGPNSLLADRESIAASTTVSQLSLVNDAISPCRSHRCRSTEITPLPVRQNRKNHHQSTMTTTYAACGSDETSDGTAVGGRSRPRSVVYINMLATGGSRTVSAAGNTTSSSGGHLIKVNSRERRAERTLIWVFVAFVVLWLPFFCTNLAYGLCESCRVPDGLFAAFTWLGYLSSGVNPCIYTYLNPDFRSAFRNIIACRGRRSRFRYCRTVAGVTNDVSSGLGVAGCYRSQQQWTSRRYS